LRLTFKQISVGALLATVIATVILFLGELVTSDADYPAPTFSFVYALIAVFAWPFCWTGLAIATLLLNERRTPDWIWHPVSATLLGAAVGLILGVGIATPVSLVSWIGMPYGAASGLIAGLMFQRRKSPE
jgi:hypothetical protein